MKVRRRPHPDCIGRKSNPNTHQYKMQPNVGAVLPDLMTRSGMGGGAPYHPDNKASFKYAYDKQRTSDMLRWGFKKNSEGKWYLS